MEEDKFGKCPLTTAQKLLQGKWSILIMSEIRESALRFNELQRRLPKMTHVTLSRQLKSLEESGLINRVEHEQIPPRVEYSLSEMGKEFLPVLDSLEAWGSKYIEYLEGRKRRTRKSDSVEH